MLVSIAYSQDTDDAFMVMALRDNLIPVKPFLFSFHSKDIEDLNTLACHGVYDISAISIAAYPYFSTRYYLMPIGASIGDQFGPALIVNQDSPTSRPEDLLNKRIAIPGKHTSTFLAALCCLEPFEAVFMPFHQIAHAIQTKQVDAGIVIHELQLTYQTLGFKKLADLGLLWYKTYKLPLPLGGNVIRRHFDHDMILALTQLYKESIVYAQNHQEVILEKAANQATAKLPPPLAKKYISMYANERTHNFADDVLAAMKIMFSKGAQLGFYRPVDLNKCLWGQNL